MAFKVRGKTTLLVVLLMMALLFIISFQPIIVGNVVYSGDEVDLSDYPYPFVKNNYYNDLYIVIGDNHDAQELFAALDVADGLKGYRTYKPTIVVESQLPKDAHSIIAVGTPCSNSIVAAYLGTNDCNALEDKGLISLMAKDRSALMVVTGKTPEDVRKAGLLLGYYKLYTLMGNQVLVSGSINSYDTLSVEYRK